jgi:SAM-dependent methyltransferase
MCSSNDNEWFRGWFNSPYYHMLYRHRDEAEAARFLDNLMDALQLPQGKNILDLACGKGRHAIYLNQKGYQVTGIDLSEESIKLANTYSTNGLSFFTADMRCFDLNSSFDAVLNLFTSFGYFDETAENERVLQRVNLHLKDRGLFVMDYFNPATICCKTNGGEIEMDGVKFRISKKIDSGHVIKEIHVIDGNHENKFMEKVQLFTLHELQVMLKSNGFDFISVKGNYSLEEFNEKTSERMIIIAQKS